MVDKKLVDRFISAILFEKFSGCVGEMTFQTSLRRAPRGERYGCYDEKLDEIILSDTTINSDSTERDCVLLRRAIGSYNRAGFVFAIEKEDNLRMLSCNETELIATAILLSLGYDGDILDEKIKSLRPFYKIGIYHEFVFKDADKYNKDFKIKEELGPCQFYDHGFCGKTLDNPIFSGAFNYRIQAFYEFKRLAER